MNVMLMASHKKVKLVLIISASFLWVDNGGFGILFYFFSGLQQLKLVPTKMLQIFSKKYQLPHQAQNGIMNREIKNGMKLKLTKVIHIIGTSKPMVRIFALIISRNTQCLVIRFHEYFFRIILEPTC